MNSSKVTPCKSSSKSLSDEIFVCIHSTRTGLEFVIELFTEFNSLSNKLGNLSLIEAGSSSSLNPPLVCCKFALLTNPNDKIAPF